MAANPSIEGTCSIGLRPPTLQLEHSLRGEARLVSMSPDELELRVFAASSRGHLAVHGTTGQLVQGENQVCWHSVSFGFEFELGQLSAAIAEPWVQRHLAYALMSMWPATNPSIARTVASKPASAGHVKR